MEKELKDINQRVFDNDGGRGGSKAGDRTGNLTKKVNFANIASDNLLR
jgi:hypothetical protein